MQAFKLNDGTIINIDHVLEIPSKEILDDAKSKGSTVGIRISTGYIKYMTAEDAIMLRTLVFEE